MSNFIAFSCKMCVKYNFDKIQKKRNIRQKRMYHFCGLIWRLWNIKTQSEKTNPKLSLLFGIPQFLLWEMLALRQLMFEVMAWHFWNKNHFHNKGWTKWTKITQAKVYKKIYFPTSNVWKCAQGAASARAEICYFWHFFAHSNVSNV